MSVLIFLLSTAAIFTYCKGMTDTHILPKWLCTLGVVAVVGMIEGLIKNKKSREKRRTTHWQDECNMVAVQDGIRCCTCKRIESKQPKKQ